MALGDVMVRCSYAQKKSKGFTLVELSIVIVIIGLIIAGVTAGQSLVNSAQLRSLVTEQRAFFTAVNSFKLQYNSLPGDMTNAASYFTACVDSGGNLCNGNGNKLVDSGVGNEVYRVWQHLTLSGILPGSYTGLHTSAIGVLGVNMPASAYKSVGWIYINYSWNSSGWDKPSTGNCLMAGKARTAGYPIGDFLTPAQISSIDSKIDDNKPGLGRVQSYYLATACNTTAIVNTANYPLSTTTSICSLIFYP